MSSTAAVRSRMSRDLGVPPETLRRFVRRVEADEGLRPDLPTAAEREEIKALRRENYELRRANEILKAASVLSERSMGRERVGSERGERVIGAAGELAAIVSDARVCDMIYAESRCARAARDMRRDRAGRAAR